MPYKIRILYYNCVWKFVDKNFGVFQSPLSLVYEREREREREREKIENVLVYKVWGKLCESKRV